MERFLSYILAHLVEHRQDLEVYKETIANKTVFRLKHNESDVGRIVGKNGSTIAAIRNLLGVAAAKQGAKATVEIIEEVRRK